MPASTVVVLSIGRDPQSLAHRSQVLSDAGFVVVEARSAPEIVEKVFESDFDIAVICSSVPADERNKIARLLRLHRPTVPILAVAAFTGQTIPEGARAVPADPQQLVPLLGDMALPARPAEWSALRAS